MTPLAILQHVIVWLPLVIGGILLIRAGLKGRRINDHPICRRCRFDLVGLGALSHPATPDTAPESGATKEKVIGSESRSTQSHPDRCPECGTDLTGTTRRARRAVIDGERRKRWRFIVLGVVLLLAGLGIGFWLSYKPLAKFPWTSWMPDWVLAEMIDTPNPIRRDAVGREIMLRINGDRFARNTTQRTIDSILRAHAAPAAPWSPVMGDIVEAARAQGMVDDDTMRTYYTNIFSISAAARPTIGTEEPFVYQLAFAIGKGGNGRTHPAKGDRDLKLVVSYRTIAIEFEDGTRHETNDLGGWFSIISGSSGSSSDRFAHQLKPGKHTATLHAHIAAHETSDPATGMPTDQPLFEQRLALPLTFRVTDRTDIAAITDDAKRADMAAAFAVDHLKITPDTPENREPDQLAYNDRVDLHLRVSSPPLPYCFSAHLVLADRVIDIGLISGVQSQGVNIFGLNDWHPDQEPLTKLPVDFATLHLTPNTEAAKSNINLKQIWGEAIVIENVPIKWIDNRP
ncbi:MAG: hypothetical protein KF902_14610 [Phycisphaeraceae bacterium]|nr:hypothetical protein [Phycisphaeraceae bacterium]